MKAALVYTSTTPELIELVEKEVHDNLGADAELLSYQDPSILAETREHGYVTAQAASRLFGLFLQAVQDGAEAILNICSSVGEAADSVQDMAKYLGVPIVRIDEEMCRDAVRRGTKIAVVATLPTTLNPTKNTILRVAREMGKHVELIDGLAEVFGCDGDAFKERLTAEAVKAGKDADVILLCQGSMAFCEERIAAATGKPTLSSPAYGARELKKALQAKGLL